MNAVSPLTELVATVIDVAPGALPDAALRNDVEAWDSLAHLSVVAALEETYGVAFSTDEITELVSIAEIRRILGAKGVAA